MVANFGLIFLCLVLGLLLRRARKLPENAPAVLNAYILNVALPAVALLSLHDLQFGAELLYPVAMAWILFALAWLFFAPVGKFLGWRPSTVGSLILTGGLANTSFVGFPLLVALYGPDSLRVGVLADQPGSFLVMSSLGVLTASAFSTAAAASRHPKAGQAASREAGLSSSLRSLPARLLRFPAFVAMLVALASHSWPYPAPLREILEKLSATLIPLALVSIGLQMRIDLALLKRHGSRLAAGLGFKLVLAPAILLLIYVFALGARGRDIQITLAESAMAPMLTGAILAIDHDLDPELAQLMITVGIPLSLMTVPIWFYALNWV
jgi:predicted permease